MFKKLITFVSTLALTFTMALPTMAQTGYVNVSGNTGGNIAGNANTAVSRPVAIYPFLLQLMAYEYSPHVL